MKVQSHQKPQHKTLKLTHAVIGFIGNIFMILKTLFLMKSVGFNYLECP